MVLSAKNMMEVPPITCHNIKFILNSIRYIIFPGIVNLVKIAGDPQYREYKILCN